MKLKFIITFLVTFFTPIYSSLITCGLLIIFDTITGVIKAKKNGDEISSSKLKNAIIKLFLYQFTIIAAHAIELHMLDWIPVVKIVLGAIATVEFYSVLENISIITGKDLLTSIKDKIENLLNKK